MDEAIFLVSEGGTNMQGFTCANHQTGYVWRCSLSMERKGAGMALLDAAMARLRQAGHRQAFFDQAHTLRVRECLPPMLQIS